jgi:hypothetical protein
MRRENVKILGEYWRVVQRLFSQILLVLDRKKLIALAQMLTMDIIFEKRAAN